MVFVFNFYIGGGGSFGERFSSENKENSRKAGRVVKVFEVKKSVKLIRNLNLYIYNEFIYKSYYFTL